MGYDYSNNINYNYMTNEYYTCYFKINMTLPKMTVKNDISCQINYFDTMKWDVCDSYVFFSNHSFSMTLNIPIQISDNNKNIIIGIPKSNYYISNDLMVLIVWFGVHMSGIFCYFKKKKKVKNVKKWKFVSNNLVRKNNFRKTHEI